MKFPSAQTLASVAELINAKYEGDPQHPISGINEIHKVEDGDLVFVDNQKYYSRALESAATTILIDQKVECPDGKALIFSDDPFRDFNLITAHFNPFSPSLSMISESAKIGTGTVLQPNVFIGDNVVLGSNCILHPGVVIYNNSSIGNNVVIHANTVIGADAFYYKKRDEGYDRLLSGGRVVIKDNVEIGASCTIDRGVSGDTVIGSGTKLDNLIMIGHDTEIGKNCLFAPHVAIAGAVIVEDDVTLWGQVGIASGLTIGKGAVVLGQSGISKSLQGNITYFGSPAIDAHKKFKEMALIRRLPRIIEKLEHRH